MEIKKTAYLNNPNSYECRVGQNRLVITTDFGPRILHLSVNDGPNILFVDEEKRMGGRGWLLYGGHRLWMAPETADTYAPDNEPCRVEGGKSDITVTAYEGRLGLEKSIRISEKDGGFLVEHIVANRSDLLITGAIWALTCVVPSGTAFFPWGTGASWDLKKVVYWQRWMDHGTDVTGPQYAPTADLFLIRPSGEEGKVGTAGHGGFIGVTAGGYTFIKKFDRHPGAAYPDEECAVQCYTCAEFLELETLSPLATFYPDIPVFHTEQWIVSDRSVDPEDGDAVRKLLNRA